MFTVVDKLGRTNHYGDGGHWYTDEMLAGAETVEEHLMTGHGLSAAEIAALDFEACHTEHDRLHTEIGDDVVLAYMESTGFLKLFGS